LKHLQKMFKTCQEDLTSSTCVSLLKPNLIYRYFQDLDETKYYNDYGVQFEITRVLLAIYWQYKRHLPDGFNGVLCVMKNGRHIQTFLENVICVYSKIFPYARLHHLYSIQMINSLLKDEKLTDLINGKVFGYVLEETILGLKDIPAVSDQVLQLYLENIQLLHQKDEYQEHANRIPEVHETLQMILSKFNQAVISEDNKELAQLILTKYVAPAMNQHMLSKKK